MSKQTAVPDPNALYVVVLAPDAHSKPMLFDDAMIEWKRAVGMQPQARIKPWEYVSEEERKRGMVT